MSVFSNYYFLTQHDYLESDINGYKKIDEAISEKQNQLDSWINSINNKAQLEAIKNQIDDYLRIVNALMSSDPNPDKKERELIREMIKDIKKECDNRIILEALNSISEDRLEKVGIMGSKAYDEIAGIRKQTLVQTIRKFARDVTRNLQKIDGGKWRDSKNVARTLDEISLVGKKNLAAIEKELSNISVKTDKVSDKYIKQAKLAIQKIKGAGKSQDAIVEGMDELFEIANALDAGFTIQNFKGTISELAVKSLLKLKERAMKDSLKRLVPDIQNIHTTKTSTNTHARGYKLENKAIMSDYIGPNKKGENTLLGRKITATDLDNKVQIRMKEVQDKVDISLTYTDNQKKQPLLPSGISLKNYAHTTLTKGISNSTTNFLMLMQNEDPLLQHYINAHAVRGGSGSTTKTGREKSAQLMRKIAIAKLVAGYHTTSGVTLGNGEDQMIDPADILIVIEDDKNTGLFTSHIYSMKSVLEAIYEESAYRMAKKIKIPTDTMFAFMHNSKYNRDVTPYYLRVSRLLKAFEVGATFTMPFTKKMKAALGKNK